MDNFADEYFYTDGADDQLDLDFAHWFSKILSRHVEENNDSITLLSSCHDEEE